jgi:hypothetical protein
MRPNIFVSGIYKLLLSLPHELDNDELRSTQPQVIYISNVLLESKAFYILPSSTYQAMNPLQIPREIFVRDEEDNVEVSRADSSKKGRPSKRDKQKKAKDAIGALDKWLGKNTLVYRESADEQTAADVPTSTHVLMSHPPIISRDNYRLEKSCLLDSLGVYRPCESSPEDMEGQKALKRANEAVLARLRAIDEMAASRGMEVGGEGGEKTGLARVERAVSEIGKRGGILGLLDGSGTS